PDNFREVAAAGADIMVMGSAFYGSGDYGALVRALQDRSDRKALRARSNKIPNKNSRLRAHRR
ncbi:MAG: hypothetical protein M0Z58_09950, partial [Nitrospiraceae bacterium]|nr:hypothetical protein [Nitrospiraceae bacterium]